MTTSCQRVEFRTSLARHHLAIESTRTVVVMPPPTPGVHPFPGSWVWLFALRLIPPTLQSLALFRLSPCAGSVPQKLAMAYNAHASNLTFSLNCYGLESGRVFSGLVHMCVGRLRFFIELTPGAFSTASFTSATRSLPGAPFVTPTPLTHCFQADPGR